MMMNEPVEIDGERERQDERGREGDQAESNVTVDERLVALHRTLKRIAKARALDGVMKVAITF